MIRHLFKRIKHAATWRLLFLQSLCFKPKRVLRLDNSLKPGVNLVGYAGARLGLGEHVRMSAKVFNTATVDFGVINHTLGCETRQHNELLCDKHMEKNIFKANLIHITGHALLPASAKLERDFFRNRYNILYPAWELSKWPKAWWAHINPLIDELWAPTHFIYDSIIAENPTIPVKHMPVSVSLPNIPHYEREHFNLPQKPFLFLGSFDFLSHIERKNPQATVQAFKSAFPESCQNVGLVLKVMNANTNDQRWKAMLDLIDKDPRIFVIDKKLSRNEMLGLYTVTDAYVSLHRSEGFGYGPAEAMYLKKPVIVTNYSGNIDYTKADNACLVDFELIKVKPKEYIYSKNQVWADANIEHAAWYMRKLVNEPLYAANIAERGAQFIHEHHNPTVIAKNYTKRLTELGLV